MRAAVVEEPGKLVIRNITDPQPGEYDALCELLYGATCTGTDLHIIRGTFPFKVEYPTILGHESIGRVVRLGSKARNIRVGDLITRVGAPPADGCSVNWGGFAGLGLARDYRAAREDGLPPSEWNPFRVNQILPLEIEAKSAVMIITWRETLSYITRMGFSAGKSILIVGSGGNGLSFAAHASNLGASQIAMLGNPCRVESAKAVGVNTFVDYRDEGALDSLRAFTSEGFDFIIDAIGKKETLDRVIGLVARGGTVGIYGVDDWGKWVVRPGNARGSFTFSSPGYDEEESHERVVSFILEGKLWAEPWLDLSSPFRLDDISDAFEAVEKRKMVKALVSLS